MIRAAWAVLVTVSYVAGLAVGLVAPGPRPSFSPPAESRPSEECVFPDHLLIVSLEVSGGTYPVGEIKSRLPDDRVRTRQFDLAKLAERRERLLRQAMEADATILMTAIHGPGPEFQLARDLVGNVRERLGIVVGGSSAQQQFVERLVRHEGGHILRMGAPEPSDEWSAREVQEVVTWIMGPVVCSLDQSNGGSDGSDLR